MIVLAPKDGQTVDPAELIAFLRPRMAHFMIPRYIRILDELPKTPTTKIQKGPLRAEGITPDTWDRDKARITVKVERLK
ncbi:MAG: AMP-binding enzyme [Hyphomicrobiaceae bacterium]